jgi:selenocysteine lyase/cysteine desulfurase
VNEFLNLWDELGASAWYEIWWAALGDVRARFARLVGAQPHETALAASVSAALSAIASSLDYRQRNRVVVAELDFPTVAYQWLAKREQGVEVVLARSDDRIGVPLERFAELIDERTALVATSRVYFTSGYIQDVAALAELAHARGALLLVDDYHGTGQLPIDVKAAGVDMLLSGGLKWLLGGPGLAYLYVRDDLIPRLRPTVTGWFAHQHQFSFAIEHFALAEDARRFESGTPAVAAAYAARAGLEIVEEIGPPLLRERTSALSADVIRRAQEAGYAVRSPLDDERRAGIVTLAMDDPASAVAYLAQHDIIVDHRPGLLRISPYFYNTVEDNERLFAALATMDRIQSPRRHGDTETARRA